MDVTGEGEIKRGGEKEASIEHRRDLTIAPFHFYKIHYCYVHLLIMRACSSMRLPSPMTMGPASAIMRALGWTTVLAPGRTIVKCVTLASYINHFSWLQSGYVLSNLNHVIMSSYMETRATTDKRMLLLIVK